MRRWETAPTRAKAATLKRGLGKEGIGHLDRSRLIDDGKMWGDQGAGSMTLSIDIGVIKVIIPHAATVHGSTFFLNPSIWRVSRACGLDSSARARSGIAARARAS